MTTGFYGNTTAGWCGNCGRRRGPDGRCANCDPWWTSPLFQVGGPIVLLVSLILIVSVSVLRNRTETAGGDRANRIPATVIQPNIPAYSVPAYAPPSLPPVAIAPPPASVVNYTPPPTQLEIQYQQLQELRAMTSYVDAVVAADQATRAQQTRYQSWYPAPASRPVGVREINYPRAQSF